MTDRRTQLADAAIALVAESGMRGLTHRAVDARAGLPPGTTSAYLRTRQALIEAVVARIAELDLADMAGRTPAAPQPTADIGCPLVKTSASGPMPTSRYWLQSPSACSAALAEAAASLPGTMSRRLAPIRPAMRPRTSSAFAGSPAARSSITRSTIERAKVTPQALSACRSQGATSRARSAAPGSEAAARSSTVPSHSPSVAPSQPTGSSSSSRSRTVGASREVTSKTPPLRTVTTQGPVSATQARPTQVPSASSGCGNGPVTRTPRKR